VADMAFIICGVAVKLCGKKIKVFRIETFAYHLKSKEPLFFQIIRVD
jgi:hypothetical protein